MKATVEPGRPEGVVTAPPSKSITQRACAAALLHHGNTVIHNAGSSLDEQAALRIIKQLGATVVREDGNIRIMSHGVNPVSDTIDCGESGLAARLFIPIAALSDKPITVSGSGTLLQRPLGLLDGILPELHVQMAGTNGHLPVLIRGPLVPRDISIDGSESSQFISGILFALCYAQQTPLLTLNVTDPKSTPYLDLTIDVLRKAGYHIEHDRYETFRLHQVAQRPTELELEVEADWSGAAAMLVAGALAGEVTVKEMHPDSRQADKAVLSVLENVGASVTWQGNSVTASRANLMSFEFDATDCPDLFPVLAILAACCRGESYIKGVHRLFTKESNRAESISEMLENFDVPYSIEDDTLAITGVKRLSGTIIDAHNDHRIVMAAAIGALRAGSRVDIVGAEAVNKSYPAFFNDLVLCGAKCNFSS